MTSAAPALFGFGQFLGTYERRHEAGGFLLADIIPAVPDRHVPRHTHEEAHFILVLDGVYVTSAHGAPDPCPAPALIYNPPGTTHRDRFRSKTGRFMSVSITSETLGLAGDQYLLIESPTRLFGSALLAGQRLAAECAAGPPAAAGLLAEGLCWELLAGAQPDGGQVHTAPGWLKTARDLLRDCAAADLRLHEVAALVGVHPIHLTRAFRRFFHCTPGDYLRRCRAERAAGLLRSTRLPLADVALAAGFADQSHFTRSFRRMYGVAPGAYRRVVT